VSHRDRRSEIVDVLFSLVTFTAKLPARRILGVYNTGRRHFTAWTRKSGICRSRKQRCRRCMGIGAMRRLPFGASSANSAEGGHLIEQFLSLVAFHPVFELLEMIGMRGIPGAAPDAPGTCPHRAGRHDFLVRSRPFGDRRTSWPRGRMVSFLLRACLDFPKCARRFFPKCRP